MKKKSIDELLKPKFTFHEDAGHGWLEVPYHILAAVGVTKRITECSYRDGNTVYLEEDLDAATFVKAWLKYVGKDEDDYAFFKARVKETYDGRFSFIRGFDHYDEHEPSC